MTYQERYEMLLHCAKKEELRDDPENALSLLVEAEKYTTSGGELAHIDSWKGALRRKLSAEKARE